MKIYSYSAFLTMFMTVLFAGFNSAKTQPITLPAGTIKLIQPNGLPGKPELPTIKNPYTPVKLLKVAFEADITRETLVTTEPTLRFDAIKYNDGSGFSLTDNTFTVPTSGLYFFSVNLFWNGFGCSVVPAAYANVSLRKNVSEGLQYVTDHATNSLVGGFTSSFNFSTKLQVGDKLNVSVVTGVCGAGGGSLSYVRKGMFSGYLIYAD